MAGMSGGGSSLAEAIGAVEAACSSAGGDRNALYDAAVRLRLAAEQGETAIVREEQRRAEAAIDLLLSVDTSHGNSPKRGPKNAKQGLEPPIRRVAIGTLRSLYLRGDKLPLYARVSGLQGLLSGRESRDGGLEAYARTLALESLAALHAAIPEELCRVASSTVANCSKHIRSGDTVVRGRAMEAAAEAIRSMSCNLPTPSNVSGSPKATNQQTAMTEVIKMADKAYRDKAASVRSGAMQVLEAAGDVALPALFAKKGDGVEDALKLCHKALEDPDMKVQNSAAAALGSLVSSASISSATPGNSWVTTHLVVPFGKASPSKKSLLTTAWAALLSSPATKNDEALLSRLLIQCFDICAVVDEMSRNEYGEKDHAIACVLHIVGNIALPLMAEDEQLSFLKKIMQLLDGYTGSRMKQGALLHATAIVLDAVGELGTGEEGNSFREKLAAIISANVERGGNATVRYGAARALGSVALSIPSMSCQLGRDQLAKVTESHAKFREKGGDRLKAIAALNSHILALSAILCISDRLALGLPRSLTTSTIEIALTMVTKGSQLPERQIAWHLISSILVSTSSSILAPFRADLLAAFTSSLNSRLSEQLLKVRNPDVVKAEITWRCTVVDAIQGFCSSSLIHDAAPESATAMNDLLLSCVQKGLDTVMVWDKFVSIGTPRLVLARFALSLCRAFLCLIDSTSHKHMHKLLLKVATLPFRDASFCEKCSGLVRLLEASDAVLGDELAGNGTMHQYCASRDRVPLPVWAPYLEKKSRMPNVCRSTRAAIVTTPVLEDFTDTLIGLLMNIFPHMDTQLQVQTFSLIEKSLKSLPRAKDADFRSAISTNASTAMLGCLKLSKSLNEAVVAKAMNVARILLENTADDIILQRSVAEVFAHSSRLMGDSGATTTGKTIAQQCVAATDPGMRATLSLSLGCLHRSMGGMALSPLVPITFDALVSVAKEPIGHSHRWALYALSLVADSAGFAFMRHVRLGLDLALALLMKESLYSQNLVVAAACLANSTVAVLGPELSPNSAVFFRQAGLISENESLPGSDTIRHSANSSKCAGIMETQRMLYTQQLLLFAPQAVPSEELMRRLRLALFSSRSEVRGIAIEALRHAIERDYSAIDTAWHMEYTLFSMLDRETDSAVEVVIKKTLKSLFLQSCPLSSGSWMRSLSNIALGSRELPSASLTPDIPEEYGEEEEEEEERTPESQIEKASCDSLPEDHLSNGAAARTSTRAFAASCLALLPESVGSDPAHFDLELAHASSSGNDYLVLHLGDLIGLGYKHLLAAAEEIESSGMTLLVSTLRKFEASMDPEFEGHSLMEQYQAQLISALRASLAPSARPRLVVGGSELVVRFVVGNLWGGEPAVLKRVMSMLIFHLQNKWDAEEYSNFAEWCSATVRIGLLEAFARLVTHGHGDMEKDLIVELVRPHMSSLFSRWSSLLFDYVVLFGQSESISIQYQPQLYSGACLDATTQVRDKYKSAVEPILLAITADLGQVDDSLARCVFTAAALIVRECLNEAYFNTDSVTTALLAWDAILRHPSARQWCSTAHCTEISQLLLATASVYRGSPKVLLATIGVLKVLIEGRGEVQDTTLKQDAISVIHRCISSVCTTTIDNSMMGNCVELFTVSMRTLSETIAANDQQMANGVVPLCVELVGQCNTFGNAAALFDSFYSGISQILASTFHLLGANMRDLVVLEIVRKVTVIFHRLKSENHIENIVPVMKLIHAIGIEVTTTKVGEEEEGTEAIVGTLIGCFKALMGNTHDKFSAAVLQAIREGWGKMESLWAGTLLVEIGPLAASQTHKRLNMKDPLMPDDVLYVSETLKLFLVASTTFQKDCDKRAILRILVPLLIETASPLPPAEANPALVAMAVKLITHLATTGSPGFKEILSSLPPKSKERLQNSLRSQQSTGAKPHTQYRSPQAFRSSTGPGINLKMNFLPK